MEHLTPVGFQIACGCQPGLMDRQTEFNEYLQAV